MKIICWPFDTCVRLVLPSNSWAFCFVSSYGPKFIKKTYRPRKQWTVERRDSLSEYVPVAMAWMISGRSWNSPSLCPTIKHNTMGHLSLLSSQSWKIQINSSFWATDYKHRALLLQLFIRVDNGWLHNVLPYH